MGKKNSRSPSKTNFIQNQFSPDLPVQDELEIKRQRKRMVKIVIAVFFGLIFIYYLYRYFTSDDSNPITSLTKKYFTQEIYLNENKLELSEFTKVKINCPEKSYLTNITLSNQKANYYRYNYECQSVSETLQISKKTMTSKTILFNYTSNFFEVFSDMEIKCGEDSVLSKFSYKVTESQNISNLDKSINLEYECLSIPNNINYCEDQEISIENVSFEKTDMFSYLKSIKDKSISVNPELKQVINGLKFSLKNIETVNSLGYQVKICTLSMGTTKIVYSDLGSIKPLSKLDINCGPDGAINGFGLKLPSETTMTYEFSCQKINSGSDVVSKQTTYSEISPKGDFRRSTPFLDHHNVECEDGYAIQQFKLMIKESSETKIYYQYKCIAVEVIECHEELTEETDGAEVPEIIPRSTYLAEQRIVLKPGQVLKKFQLRTKYGYHSFPYYNYEYTYCILKKTK